MTMAMPNEGKITMMAAEFKKNNTTIGLRTSSDLKERIRRIALLEHRTITSQIEYWIEKAVQAYPSVPSDSHQSAV